MRACVHRSQMCDQHLMDLCFVLSSSTRMWKTGGCLASISVYPWPALLSSTHLCPVRCWAAKKACELHSTTTWNRYGGTVLTAPGGPAGSWMHGGHSSACFCVCPAEGSSQDGLLPGVHFRSLLAAASSQSYSEENNLRWKWPPPLRTAQVGVQPIVFCCVASCRVYCKHCPFPCQLPVGDGLHWNQYGFFKLLHQPNCPLLCQSEV